MSQQHHVAFAMRSPSEQRARVRRLAADGWGDHAIAAGTGWTVDQVRECIASRSEETPPGDESAEKGA